MRRSIIISTILFLTTFNCSAQKEYLEPAGDPGKNINSELKDRNDSLYAQLYNGFSTKPYARYTVIHAMFTPQYSFSVEQKGNKYYIITNTVRENYRTRIIRDNKLVTRQREIGQELYEEIGIIFNFLEKQTRIPENQIMGFDGVSYYFAITDSTGRVKTGCTRSPHKYSLMRELVRICDKLYAIGNGGNVNEVRLVKRLVQLQNELRLNNS